jgi:outer membrane protein OmpA-like peptidoglycan-associated protein
MPDDRAPWESTSPSGQLDPSAEELAELRELLLGAERRRLQELERRLDEPGITRDALIELLPEAIVARTARDRQLARALAPTVEGAISESVRRNPRPIATAIFPVLGPAIRKAIAESLSALVASINQTIEHSFSARGLRWRLEAWRTGVPFAQVVLKHALIYRVEQAFLIHAETGLLLSHAWAPDLPASDPDLIAGMLTAIRDFVADSFSPERDAGGLRRFHVGELLVMVEHGPAAVLAAVVRGQPPDALLVKLQDTLETIHLQFAGALTEFDGDSTAFEAARPLLEECLATEVATDRSRERRGPAAWLPWLVTAILLIAVAGGLALRSAQRWGEARDALGAQPGIVVTDAERGGRWSFAGLRDPLAADPSVVLARAGVDTADVDQRWDPYLSLEPELLLKRAGRTFAPPAGVTLSLVADTIALRGSAPLPWVIAARRLPLPAGIGALDLSGVTPIIPADLAALVSDIETRRVLFQSGSATLDRAARSVVEDVAGKLNRLDSGVALIGARASLELVGRADPTGTDSLNQSLSRQRAEAVVAALAARGVPTGSAQVSGIGTRRPLAEESAEEQSRINRSVSFGVSLR